MVQQTVTWIGLRENWDIKMRKLLFFIFIIAPNLFCMESQLKRLKIIEEYPKFIPLDIQKDIAERALRSFENRPYNPLEMPKFINSITGNFKTYINLKRANKGLREYLDEIVDPINQITRYQQWVLNKYNDFDFADLNQYLLSTANKQFNKWPRDPDETKSIDNSLYLLTEFLIHMKKFNKNLKTNRKTNLLEVAIGGNLTKVALILIKFKFFDINEDNGFALRSAISARNEKIIEALIKAGMDVNSKDLNGTTPLMEAAQRKGSIVKLLLNSGAKTSIDEKNNKGETALILASRSFDLEKTTIMLLLIRAGANIYEKDNDGKTALDQISDEELKDYLISESSLHV
ncbi:ankyrin repeat domain-containing protein [Candidatus Dependentiae bacterium]|nr:ankyrin repeat domain-containing protein [Candidatus Dependentiae bacterium]